MNKTRRLCLAGLCIGGGGSNPESADLVSLGCLTAPRSSMEEALKCALAGAPPDMHTLIH